MFAFYLVHFLVFVVFKLLIVYATDRQTFTGITVAQYIDEPNSDLTIEQTVAASIGYGLVPGNVVVSGVVKKLGAPPSITVNYIVTGPSTDFTSTAAAFTSYSNALTTSILSGLFGANLVSQATNNTAIYLAGTNVIAAQAIIQNVPFILPTMVPTAAPSYSPGSPTAVPTVAPTPSPTMSPTAYAAGGPTSVPTMAASPPAANLFVTQVKPHCFSAFNMSRIFQFVLVFFFNRHLLASLWPSTTLNRTAI